MWVLANFATVDEVKEGVKSIVVVPTPAPGLGSPQGAVAGARFFVQDKTGKSIVIEPVEYLEGPRRPARRHHQRADLRLAHDQPAELRQSLGEGCRGRQDRAGRASGLWLWLGPPWHARRLHPALTLRACGDLQPVCGAERDRGGRRALGLPRLNQFDIPKGSVQNSAIGGTVDEITEWTSVADLKNLRWYFRTFTDQSIHVVDLKEASRPPRASCASSRWKARRNHHRRLDEFVAGK
jgi:choloylglycine hydrolase